MKKCFQDRQRYFAQLLEKLIKMLCWWKKIGYSENRSYFFTAGCRLFLFFGSWWLLHWFLVCTSSMSDFYSIKSELFLLSIVVFYSMELSLWIKNNFLLSDIIKIIWDFSRIQPVITNLYLLHQHKHLISGAVELKIYIDSSLNQLIINVFFFSHICSKKLHSSESFCLDCSCKLTNRNGYRGPCVGRGLEHEFNWGDQSGTWGPESLPISHFLLFTGSSGFRSTIILDKDSSASDYNNFLSLSTVNSVVKPFSLTSCSLYFM